ncbi:hypothetical protein [Rhizobium sp. R339]|uniref:hypothetical protein n=1 Tax=Rhizobium sp. R339 TaxID=1764273 RepID=UPI001AECE58A|nr:hypothetical protein [Rhizobium sp. R339]
MGIKNGAFIVFIQFSGSRCTLLAGREHVVGKLVHADAKRYNKWRTRQDSNL